jgi:hypothetical protein
MKKAQMNFIKRCAECQRLWREYSIATARHITLEDELQLAGAARLTELKVQVESAAQHRSQAWQALSRHKKEAHGARGARA